MYNNHIVQLWLKNLCSFKATKYCSLDRIATIYLTNMIRHSFHLWKTIHYTVTSALGNDYFISIKKLILFSYLSLKLENGIYTIFWKHHNWPISLNFAEIKHTQKSRNQFWKQKFALGAYTAFICRAELGRAPAWIISPSFASRWQIIF